jgi:hypothetical protein
MFAYNSFLYLIVNTHPMPIKCTDYVPEYKGRQSAVQSTSNGKPSLEEKPDPAVEADNARVKRHAMHALDYHADRCKVIHM